MVHSTADNIPCSMQLNSSITLKCYYANLKGWIIRKMYKKLCSVIAFYVCNFTLNYLRYGNYKSYQYMTSARPTGAVNKDDGKIFPFYFPRGNLTA